MAESCERLVPIRGLSFTRFSERIVTRPESLLLLAKLMLKQPAGIPTGEKAWRLIARLGGFIQFAQPRNLRDLRKCRRSTGLAAHRRAIG